jgi:hypothetical protein
MIDRFRNTRERLRASEYDREMAAELVFERSRTATQSGSSHRQQTNRPPIGETRRRDWQMIALWAFVVFSFAVLGFALYAIWVKCGGQSLF